MASVKHPSIVPLDFVPHQTTLEAYFDGTATTILPPFPNWEKSFVSGPSSPLFIVSYKVDAHHPHRLLTKINFKPLTEGPPGHVHGGASAGLIDELMGILVWHNQYICMTQTLGLHYWKSLPLTQITYGVSEIVKINPTKLDVRCTLYSGDHVPYVSALAVFHRLTAEQFEKFKNKMSIA